MTATTARLVGTEWEAWANRLLAHHFGQTDYQRVPSKDKGDAGIEGFCISQRSVFQCYGCEEPIGVKERYEKQRDKMTDDIGKFIKNHSVLNGIFKPLKMRRWILFVPAFDSKEIAAHAATKTQEVIKANLPYVEDDFRVMVVQESDFAVARDQLLSTTPEGLKLPRPEVSDGAVDAYTATNDALVDRLREKLSKLPTVRSEPQLNDLVLNVLKGYLAGQELLEQLREYPEVYHKVLETKSHREESLFLSCLDGDASKGNLSDTIKSFQEELRSEVKELHSFNVQNLAQEAVADWLIRCPLSFPEAKSE